LPERVAAEKEGQAKAKSTSSPVKKKSTPKKTRDPYNRFDIF
jgi:hypothetical protein